MRPVNPTVTWPNHTSIVTGVTPARHGVLFNGTLIRQPGVVPRVEPWIDKSAMVKSPTLYDVAHARGLTTAQVDWVAIYNAPTITWEFRERPPAGAAARLRPRWSRRGSSPRLTSMISLPATSSFATRSGPTPPGHILREHKPNLLLFHLLTLDSTQHRYGPRTQAAMNTMALLDTEVAAIVQTLEDTGLAATTTLFVVSDHGFKAVKRQILPNAALLKGGLLEVTDGKVTRTQASSYPRAAVRSSTSRFPTRGANPRAGQACARRARRDRHGRRARRLFQVRTADAVCERSDGRTIPHREGGVRIAGGAGEQVVIDAPEGSLGAHGYVSSDPDLQSLFIASGRGIKPGVILPTVANVDIAPTAARLLGLEMKDVDGRVLTDILRSSISAMPVSGPAPAGRRQSSRRPSSCRRSAGR